MMECRDLNPGPQGAVLTIELEDEIKMAYPIEVGMNYNGSEAFEL